MLVQMEFLNFYKIKLYYFIIKDKSRLLVIRLPNN